MLSRTNIQHILNAHRNQAILNVSYMSIKALLTQFFELGNNFFAYFTYEEINGDFSYLH